MTQQKENIQKQYFGRILDGRYSAALKKRVSEGIETLVACEQVAHRLIPYIAAWHEDRKIIWYEYAGREFCDLLDCSFKDLAESFRKSIIDQRIYRYTNRKKEVEERIITRDELRGGWRGLREEVKESGRVEAVYKVLISDSNTVWLKDQASIETFKEDNTCISIGFLTDVTKEMELKDLFQRIGYIDELTKLPRRSILDRILEVNIGNLQRGHIEDFVLILIDVDHFKLVNDRHGHLAGDHILATLADVMRSTTRKQDEIGRYGGEEFYGFTIGDINTGLKFAERLRKRVEKYSFTYKKEIIPITVSIGLVSATQVGKVESLTADQLIFMVDKSLYAAKQSGRNRVASVA
jgi:diguanylate cyclase (GGDEF)-like protein